MTGMPWGGSEILWLRTAKMFRHAGHDVSVNYKWWPSQAQPLTDLEQLGGKVCLRDQPTKARWKQMFTGKQVDQGVRWLQDERPDAVLFTLGFHPDRFELADECVRLGIPYGINVQCASDTFFIHGNAVDDYRRWYQNAKRVFFVSEENQHKVQNNIALNLDNSCVIANPFKVPYDSNPAWPDEKAGLSLAVVGRIHFQSKGQDLIVDVMKQDKWKQRNLNIRFYGQDQGNARQLKELIKLYDLKDQMTFGGYVPDVRQVWEQHHGLLLPSRYEGAPLVVIEAMLCNRFAVSTDIGRNRELIDDNYSGFIADAPTVALLDDAMERAWQQRDQWQEIGKLAGQHIRERYPEDPIAEFMNHIQSLAS
jgi:glycosyltransferase involved in cell wall biosynthesis